jgi:hypothetical protein
MLDSGASSTDKKAQVFMSKILDHLEDIAMTQTETPVPITTRSMYVGAAAGIGLATVLEHNGWLAFLRLVFGAIKVRYSDPGLVRLDTVQIRS